MKNKLIYGLPIIATLFMIILSTAFYPAYNPTPKDIPLAIMNSDIGTEAQDTEINIGKTLVDTITSNENEVIEWHIVDNEQDLEQGLEDQEFVGALVIEQDFSKNAMSHSQKILIDNIQKQIESGELSQEQIQAMQEQADSGNPQEIEPKKAQIKTITNDGPNAQLAQSAKQMLGTMADNINEQVSNQNINILVENNIDIPSDQAEDIKIPVEIETTALNEIKENQANGNAQSVMFTPVWFASMIIAILTFFTFRNRDNALDIKGKHKQALLLPLMAILTSFIAGFSYVYYTGWAMNFDFNQPFITAIYMSLAILAFSSLLVGIMAWIGLATIPIFILFLFFTMQAAMLPVQMLPEFYQDYIVPWNPFAQFISTLREILYTGAGLSLNGTMWMFISFIIFGLGSLITAIYIKQKASR